MILSDGHHIRGVLAELLLQKSNMKKSFTRGAMNYSGLMLRHFPGPLDNFALSYQQRSGRWSKVLGEEYHTCSERFIT